MKKLFAIIAAVAAGASGASAQNQMQNAPVANPSTPIANFDIQSIGPVLNELGVAWQATTSDNGQTYIRANFGGILNFNMTPTACRGDGNSDCIGLATIAIFEGNANPQTVGAFNHRYAFATAGLAPSGEAYTMRYDIADYGIPRGNLASSILNFVNLSQMFREELATSATTVAQQGYADDLASRSMNRAGLDEMTGGEVNHFNPVELHERGFEFTARLVNETIADETAPRNKILNKK
ncbi:MAG: hypothetical protein HKN14_02255 [Marinicaulis sp.]|nr:YbjN domain-containing protein [Marinicaulis sp.]NNE39721.1 hypothetical protein [Marinicaulis sp.]NNL88759.1 hypothetical protein [Marinicaulis sp.]